MKDGDVAICVDSRWLGRPDFAGREGRQECGIDEGHVVLLRIC